MLGIKTERLAYVGGIIRRLLLMAEDGEFKILVSGPHQGSPRRVGKADYITVSSLSIRYVLSEPSPCPLLLRLGEASDGSWSSVEGVSLWCWSGS